MTIWMKPTECKKTVEHKAQTKKEAPKKEAPKRLSKDEKIEARQKAKAERREKAEALKSVPKETLKIKIGEYYGQDGYDELSEWVKSVIGCVFPPKAQNKGGEIIGKMTVGSVLNKYFKHLTIGQIEEVKYF